MSSLQKNYVTKKKYKSRYEETIARYLRRKKAKFRYEAIRLPYVRYHDYVPDWEINTPNGIIYVESKGYLRREDKAKLAAVKRQHPEKDIRLVFYSSNKAQLKWAERQGFRFAVGMIPQEWLEGL